jgi:hypothetical protein
MAERLEEVVYVSPTFGYRGLQEELQQRRDRRAQAKALTEKETEI